MEEKHLLPLEEEHPGQWSTKGRGPVGRLGTGEALWHHFDQWTGGIVEVVAAGAKGRGGERWELRSGK